MAQNQVARRVNSPVMNVAEVCDYLRIHWSTLYHLVKTGRLPYFRLGSDYRFNHEAIALWCKDGEEHPTHSETATLSAQ